MWIKQADVFLQVNPAIDLSLFLFCPKIWKHQVVLHMFVSYIFMAETPIM